MSVTANTSETSLPMKPLRYRGWLIHTKVIDGHLWLRWQHPRDSFPRYSYPVTERGLAGTIHYARYLIDLIIKLEEESLAVSEPKAS